MRRLVWLVLLTVAASAEDVVQTLIPAPPAPKVNVWPGAPPADCPFPPSTRFGGVAFTGRHAEYAHADTWYPSWAADGDLYSPWTDGNVDGVNSGSGGRGARTGSARISGDDPLALTIGEARTFASDPAPYEGRYPCGSLVYQGVWYYGTYCLHPSGGVTHEGRGYNWPWMGPFVGFRWSSDGGRTWTQTPRTPAAPLFGESALHGEPVRFGSPHFVDFGRELANSPDGKAYLVAHGAHDGQNRRFAFDSWITGDEVYLLRVKPSVATMNDAAAYEFYAGEGAGSDKPWTADLAAAQPTAAWRDHMGCVTMTYDAPLKTYLMCVTDGTDTVSRFNSYLLESEAPTGPWRMVAYWRHFGEQGYFLNLPSKFISADGRTLWLCYAANFTGGWSSRPAGSRYGMCLREIRLLAPEERPAPSPLDSEDNVARTASVAATSTYPGYDAAGAIDGVVGGFPGDTSHEWASNGEGVGAALRLLWSEPQTIDRVWLFDRPNALDQVSAGLLVFSDGTTIRTGELPDDAKTGLEVRFAPRTVRWLLFVVTEARRAANIGLSEIAVFRAPTSTE
jgi:hypothetical protein